MILLGTPTLSSKKDCTTSRDIRMFHSLMERGGWYSKGHSRLNPIFNFKQAAEGNA